MDMNMCHACRHCNCPHHKVMPAMIGLIALVFLAKALGIISAAATDILWPILLLIAAGTKLMSGKCKCYNMDNKGMGGQM